MCGEGQHLAGGILDVKGGSNHPGVKRRLDALVACHGGVSVALECGVIPILVTADCNTAPVIGQGVIKFLIKIGNTVLALGNYHVIDVTQRQLPCLADTGQQTDNFHGSFWQNCVFEVGIIAGAHNQSIAVGIGKCAIGAGAALGKCSGAVGLLKHDVCDAHKLTLVSEQCFTVTVAGQFIECNLNGLNLRTVRVGSAFYFYQ